jgi:hypothetical protein
MIHVRRANVAEPRSHERQEVLYKAFTSCSVICEALNAVLDLSEPRLPLAGRRLFPAARARALLVQSGWSSKRRGSMAQVNVEESRFQRLARKERPRQVIS